jgi:C1A family cysteine protease
MRAGLGFILASWLTVIVGLVPDHAAAQRAAAESKSPAPEKSPAVDLRPMFEKFGLVSRQQGARPTCSVFTVAAALEFAAAKRQGTTPRLSVEYLNWAANQACGDQADGGFFSDLWKGFCAHGICTELEMPYEAKSILTNQPGSSARADAKTRLTLGLQLHWIKEWNVKTGLAEEQFTSIQNTLRTGWPVCAGLRWPRREQWKSGVLQLCAPEAVFDGHSVLFVGYRNDPSQPGGGVFIFRNTSGTGQDGAMPYAYARQYVNDAAWVDCQQPGSPAH